MQDNGGGFGAKGSKITSVADIIAGVIQGGFNSIYGLYQDQRDFQYNKSLQQKLFQREDNAVQRRVADLKAAGMNPLLAVGDAAQAGPAVRASQTSQPKMSILESVMTAQSIRAQQQEIAKTRAEADYLKSLKENTNQDTILKQTEAGQNLALTDYYTGLKYLNEDRQKLVRSQKEKVENEINLVIAQLGSEERLMWLRDAQHATELVRKTLTEAQINETASRIYKIAAEINNIDEDTARINLDNQIKSRDFNLSKFLGIQSKSGVPGEGLNAILQGVLILADQINKAYGALQGVKNE